MEFSGAKLALFLGSDVVVILRDERKDIPWPGRWDFPGGGREGKESPQVCAIRETREEIGLILQERDLVWAHSYQRPIGTMWMFAAHLPSESRDAIRFGTEGQGWDLMAPETYCEHPLAVPHFARELNRYLAERGQIDKAIRKTPRC